MGLRNWWNASREKAAVARCFSDINEDQVLIEAQVPELAGMTSVQGIAHSLQQFIEWNSTCTTQDAAEVAGRVAASCESLRAQGLPVPYWCDLWVLRRYQAASAVERPARGGASDGSA